MSESPTRRHSGVARTLAPWLRGRPFPALALLLGALYLPWIGALPLDGTLEGNRLEAAREMLHSGDWLIPRLGGAVYLAKPPFHPWTLALISWPFGDVYLAVGRSVSALATIATCGLVLAWGRRELGTRTGFLAALALGCTTLCAEKAVRAELECELMLFTTLALLAFRDASRAEGSFGLRVISGLALGAAVLVKGPPALIVFLVTASAVGFSAERRRTVLSSAASALLLGLACALVWVALAGARLGFEPLWQALHDQFVERITHAGRTNVEPFWYYVPALLVGLLPATLLLPGLIAVRPGRAASQRTRSLAVFLWSWALLPLLCFSVSSGKETRYLLPTLPAWSLLLAWGWTRARASFRLARWRGGLARMLGVTTWIAPLAWLAVGSRLYPQHSAVVAASGACALLARLAFAWSARARRPAVLFGSLFVAVLSAKAAWAGTVLAEQRRDVPVTEAGQAIAERLAPGESWILIGPYRSWWAFSVNRPCVAVPDWNALDAVLGTSTSARYVLTPVGAIPPDRDDLERVDSWVVDGEPYRLVRLQP